MLKIPNEIRLNAFRAFRCKYQERLDFQKWLLQTRPLTQFNCLREILNLKKLTGAEGAVLPLSVISTTVPEVAALRQVLLPRRKKQPSTTTKWLRLGTKFWLHSDPHFLDPNDLMRHAAFLGGTGGDGETTLALTCIEQLLLAGVPIILLDRKGDLCSYARDAAWRPANDTAERTERRAQLRSD